MGLRASKDKLSADAARTAQNKSPKAKLSELDKLRTGHEELSWYYTLWSNTIMWTLIGTSISATILASLNLTDQQKQGVQVATVALTAVAAFMSAWQRWVQPAVLADRHGLAAKRYAHLMQRATREGWLREPADQEKKDRLGTQSPDIPDRYNVMKYKFTCGASCNCWLFSPGYLLAVMFYYGFACFCRSDMSRDVHGQVPSAPEDKDPENPTEETFVHPESQKEIKQEPTDDDTAATSRDRRPVKKR